VSSAQRRKALEARVARGEHTPRRFRSQFVGAEIAIENSREIAAMSTQVRQHADKGHDSNWAYSPDNSGSRGHRVVGLRRVPSAAAPTQAPQVFVPVGTTVRDLRREYCRRVMQAHPERGGSVKDFIELTREYEAAQAAVNAK